jgi:hypothetical protein
VIRNQDSYRKYLEDVVLSLLAERGEKGDIPKVGDDLTYSPYNVREEISSQQSKRAARCDAT